MTAEFSSPIIVKKKKENAILVNLVQTSFSFYYAVTEGTAKRVFKFCYKLNSSVLFNILQSVIFYSAHPLRFTRKLEPIPVGFGRKAEYALDRATIHTLIHT